MILSSYSSSSSTICNYKHNQLSSFLSIHPTQLTFRPPFSLSQVRISVMNDGSNIGISGSPTKTSLSHTPDDTIGHINKSPKLYASAEDIVNGKNLSKAVEEPISQPKRAAKLHDFCLGIPFGGIVLIGGLAGFIITRNLSTLGTGVLFGGALLALSTFSLKVWRDGRPSLPYILGQSALAVALLWKNFQEYSLSKKLFPTGFYVFLSTAMICFYSYVVLSGGNPPPKKMKSSVIAPS